MRTSLNVIEIAIRLILAMAMGGAIGYDRESKNRPAGLRTHLLVCVGAATVAILQRLIEYDTIATALENIEIGDLIRADPSRLIAQVISGIGFLGAGTIIVTKRSVSGLTTAASLWAVACLGLAIGMGYYALACLSFLSIFIVLVAVQRIVHIPNLKHLEIQYTNPKDTKPFIIKYFREKNIHIKATDYNVDFSTETHLYSNIFTVELPYSSTADTLVEDLACNPDIQSIRAINL